MKNPIGDRHELWQSEYVFQAYTDQMGKKHDAQVVRRKVIVTVVRSMATKSSWVEGEVFEHGIWIAIDDAGVEYTQFFDELSMGGRDHWHDSLKGSWTRAQEGWLTPYMNADGTKATPQAL